MTEMIAVFRLTIFSLLLLLFPATVSFAHPHILRATDRSELSPADLLKDLAAVQVVFVGELHDQTGHHQAQLSIIRSLQNDSHPLAIGLEMFRKDSQSALDSWVDGNYPINSFLKDYNDNWSMWEKYWEIFAFARLQKVPLVGLNIPRGISTRVARNGFSALTEQERQALGNVQCAVNPEYGDFIRQAMGGHGGHGQQYHFFCEAQMLWDSMMARHLVDFLKTNPKYRVVVLAGSGHAWKFGIPRQMLELSEISYRVVLPEVHGRMVRTQVEPAFTDYLWLDEGPDGWTF